MILQAKIAKVSEPKNGTSETTGKPWTQRNVVLAFNDEEGDEYVMVGVDEDVWQRLGLEEGEEATVRLRFFTKKMMSGYVKNIIRIINPQNAQ